MNLSIVITLFNRKDLVENAIASCLLLNLPGVSYEVIIVDDGSTDKPRTILEPYIKDGSITYYEKKNGGPASAKNFGARKANGTFIIFLDSDDIFSGPNALCEFRKVEKLNVDFAFSKSVIVKNGQTLDQETTPYVGIDLYDYVLQYPLNYPGKQLYILQRKRFIDVGGFNEKHRWGDAMLFWRRYLLNCTFLEMTEPTCIYTMTEDSVSRNKSDGYYLKVLTTITDTYTDNKKIIESSGYSHNWMLVLIGVSLLAKDYCSFIKYFLLSLANPLKMIRSMIYVYNRRKNRG
uniref:glycosyltransferase family 2 protein n=1 Tax=Scandinavium goeteborgense TaxID=1851514 RepID=UPI00135C35AB|nr:glycosyltransferase family A protein [Scandinavium goeteborgense]